MIARVTFMSLNANVKKTQIFHKIRYEAIVIEMFFDFFTFGPSYLLNILTYVLMC